VTARVPPVHPVDDPAELTADWLTAALRADGQDVRVDDVVVERVGAGLMGATYRLTVAFAGPAGSLPSTFVAKLPTPDTEQRATVASSYGVELGFYTDVAATVAVRAPRCHHATASADHQAFVLLLEDMAPAEPGDQVAGCRPVAAEDAVVNLAGLHGPRWDDPSLADLSPVSELTSATGDTAVLIAEVYRSATEQFIDRFAGRLSAEDGDTLRSVAEVLGAWLGAPPAHLGPIHGDYRLDNLLFPPDGAAGVAAVDWQTLGVGLPARDLAYFLETSLQVDDRRHHEEALVEAYRRALVAHGVRDYPRQACFADYRYGLLHGPLITVLGALYGARTERGDEMFLVMAERSCQAIRDHHAVALVD
jgi:hypothetical protein